MIRFFKKLFKRGDFMTRADKAYYKYRAKTIFWSAFCLIIIAWVGTNLVLCALTTNVTSNFDMIYEATQPVTLPTGKDFNRILKKLTEFEEIRVDGRIQNLTFDKFTDGIEDKYVVGEVNVLEGAEKETISTENKIYLYRANGGADAYVLSPYKMQANPDSSYMFSNLSVTSYTFNNFDTSQVHSLSHMFSGSNGFNFAQYNVSTKAESPKFQTLNVFQGPYCPPIEAMDLSMWNTSNVTDMSSMFQFCDNLTKLTLTGWDTKNVIDMSYMFIAGSNERKTTELDLSSFDTRNVKYMSAMFYGSGNADLLKTIYVSDKFVVDQVETFDNMFKYCANLVGGKGTSCDGTTNVDKTYARIDGGPNSATPGYFTYKAYSGK